MVMVSYGNKQSYDQVTGMVTAATISRESHPLPARGGQEDNVRDEQDRTRHCHVDLIDLRLRGSGHGRRLPGGDPSLLASERLMSLRERRRG